MTPASQFQKRIPGDLLERNTSHPFRPGDVVSILAFRPGGGPPFNEGRAEVIAPMRQANYYRVRFLDDGTIRIRFVHPDHQTGDVRRHLLLLVELWHTGQMPDPNDFFPNDLA